MELCYDNLVQQMLVDFPSLKKDVDSVIKSCGQQLNHVIFGQVLNPHVRRIFSDSSSSEKDKVKIADFLEQMAVSDDKEVRAVLTDTVIEELLDFPNDFKLIEPYLKPTTASFLPAIKRFFGVS